MPAVDLHMPSGLSPSSIDLWEQCQSRYRKEKMEGRSGGTGVDAVRGTFVHQVLEMLMQREPAERTIRTAAGILTAEWVEFRTNPDLLSLGLSPQDLVTLRSEAWVSVRRYFSMENPADVEVVDTEQKVTAVIDGVSLRGIVDRLERNDLGQLVVSDYKSGKVPDKRYRAPKIRQLNLYGAMIRATTGEVPVKGRLIFTSFGEFVDTKFTKTSLDKAVAKAQETWVEIGNAVARDEFVPNPGPLCGWCHFAGECPEGLAEIRARRAAGNLKRTAPAFDLAAPAEPAPAVESF